MVFSKEDKMAWENSEVMTELEKIAHTVLDPDMESYQPIKVEEEPEWEDESNVEEKNNETILLDEANPFAIKKEMCLVYKNSLVKSLLKLAHSLGEQSKVKEAYAIEKTINRLNELFQEDENG
jgi:hypothetical protein